MKKVLIMFFIILLCLFITDVIYQSKNTQTVLLSGDVMGFDIEDNNEYKNLIPTSSQKLGIITYIKKGTHEFSALGHTAIQNSKDAEIEGICYEVNIDDIEKSYHNYIGHLCGTLKSEEKIGIVNKNNECGIFGIINKIEEKDYKEIQTASKYEIRLGEAELLVPLKNNQLQSFKIKITAINYISNNKNIKLKIQDEALLDKTGGIVQGMSGAPIVQNGKLIGAVNYANPETPENAYAIFIDKLI